MTLCSRIVVCVLMLPYELIYCVWRRFVWQIRKLLGLYVLHIKGSFLCSLCRIQWHAATAGYYVMKKVYVNRLYSFKYMTMWNNSAHRSLRMFLIEQCWILGYYFDFMSCWESLSFKYMSFKIKVFKCEETFLF